VTLLFAACSMLTKEHGITVLAVCAVYDVFVQSRLKPKDLFSSVLFQVRLIGYTMYIRNDLIALGYLMELSLVM
jgi:hypothetical protein